MDVVLYIILIAGEGLLLLDLIQTIHIVNNPKLYYETNLILGKHPKVHWVCVYFTVCIGGLLALALWLGHPYGTIVCLGVLMLEAVVTFRNYLLFNRR